MSKRATYNRDLIMLHLRLSEQDYSSMVYAEGVRYLDRYMQDDPKGKDVLLALASYWRWWRVQWERVDAEFIVTSELELYGPSSDAWQRSKLHELYGVMHDGGLLPARVSRSVMRQAITVLKQPTT